MRTRNLYLHNSPAEKHVPPIIASPRDINVYTPDPQDKHGYKAACECSMPTSIKTGKQIRIQMYHVTAARTVPEISQIIPFSMGINCHGSIFYGAVNISTSIEQ
jgi:hypothetical protein